MRLRIMSYNVLSEVIRHQTAFLYRNVHDPACTWANRLALILAEVRCFLRETHHCWRSIHLVLAVCLPSPTHCCKALALGIASWRLDVVCCAQFGLCGALMCCLRCCNGGLLHSWGDFACQSAFNHRTLGIMCLSFHCGMCAFAW